MLADAPVRMPDCPAVAPTLDDVFPVEIDAGAGCPRYLGRVIRGVDATRPTPIWLRERLRRSGLRSIDPVVDVTNYVLLELGQPMHAFDLDRLENRVVVRWARPASRSRCSTVARSPSSRTRSSSPTTGGRSAWRV